MRTRFVGNPWSSLFGKFCQPMNINSAATNREPHGADASATATSEASLSLRHLTPRRLRMLCSRRTKRRAHTRQFILRYFSSLKFENATVEVAVGEAAASTRAYPLFVLIVVLKDRFVFTLD